MNYSTAVLCWTLIFFISLWTYFIFHEGICSILLKSVFLKCLAQSLAYHNARFFLISLGCPISHSLHLNTLTSYFTLGLLHVWARMFYSGDLDWIHFTSVCNLALLGPVSSKVEGLINSEKPVKLIITVITFLSYICNFVILLIPL